MPENSLFEAPIFKVASVRKDRCGLWVVIEKVFFSKCFAAQFCFFLDQQSSPKFCLPSVRLINLAISKSFAIGF